MECSKTFFMVSLPVNLQSKIGLKKVKQNSSFNKVKCSRATGLNYKSKPPSEKLLHLCDKWALHIIALQVRNRKRTGMWIFKESNYLVLCLVQYSEGSIVTYVWNLGSQGLTPGSICSFVKGRTLKRTLGNKRNTKWNENQFSWCPRT